MVLFDDSKHTVAPLIASMARYAASGDTARLIRGQNSASFGGQEAGMPCPKGSCSEEVGILSQNDPTDHALAAIASILDQPVTHQDPGQVPLVAPEEPQPATAEGYSKLGPGPIDAIRFKWTVRRGEDGSYYVDETIGENARPAVTGPMAADAAVELVDERASEAQRRFDLLRREMTTSAGGFASSKSDGRGEI